jgi:hypothetical protein
MRRVAEEHCLDSITYQPNKHAPNGLGLALLAAQPLSVSVGRLKNVVPVPIT